MTIKKLLAAAMDDGHPAKELRLTTVASLRDEIGAGEYDGPDLDNLPADAPALRVDGYRYGDQGGSAQVYGAVDPFMTIEDAEDWCPTTHPQITQSYILVATACRVAYVFDDDEPTELQYDETPIEKHIIPDPLCTSASREHNWKPISDDGFRWPNDDWPCDQTWEEECPDCGRLRRQRDATDTCGRPYTQTEIAEV